MHLCITCIGLFLNLAVKLEWHWYTVVSHVGQFKALVANWNCAQYTSCIWGRSPPIPEDTWNLPGHSQGSSAPGGVSSAHFRVEGGSEEPVEGPAAGRDGQVMKPQRLPSASASGDAS